MKKILIAGLAALAVGACEATEAKNGDVVSIYFEGYSDGVRFEGGTGSFDLRLGSGQFIPGFEEQLVGAKVGETRDVNVVFPKNYGAANLAGKPAVFKVKVNGIK
jgi:trigger factor